VREEEENDRAYRNKDKDLATLFVGDLGDIEYGGSGAVCEVGEGGRLVGKIVK
jgi:hypothetical protein